VEIRVLTEADAPAYRDLRLRALRLEREAAEALNKPAAPAKTAPPAAAAAARPAPRVRDAARS